MSHGPQRRTRRNAKLTRHPLNAVIWRSWSQDGPHPREPDRTIDTEDTVDLLSFGFCSLFRARIKDTKEKDKAVQ